MIELPTSDNPVTVIEGDCREWLPLIPAGAVGAVITDPPYGLGSRWAGGGGSAKSSWRFDPQEAQRWDGETADAGVAAAASLGVPTVVWGGNYYPLPPSRCWFVWDKKTPDTFSTGQAELAWTNVDRPTRVFRLAQCEAHGQMHPKEHPTQKPLSLIRWCIRMMRLPPNSLILDPFGGSGTTGVAAVMEGMRAVLIEREPTYAAIARRRVADARGTGLLAGLA